MESTQSVLFIRVYLFQTRIYLQHCTRAYIFVCHYCIRTCWHKLYFLIDFSYTWCFFRGLNGASMYHQWRLWSSIDLWYQQPHMSWVYQPCFLLFDTSSRFGCLHAHECVCLPQCLFLSPSACLFPKLVICFHVCYKQTPKMLCTLMSFCMFPCLVLNSMSVLV